VLVELDRTTGLLMLADQLRDPVEPGLRSEFGVTLVTQQVEHLAQLGHGRPGRAGDLLERVASTG
jgi:hypothetical protein